MFSSVIGSGLTLSTFLLCSAVSVVLGILTAIIFTIKNRGSSSFVLTLSLLPLAVQLVIMLVNGNIGTGVAIAGAFSLVRFRSAAGKGREIAAIFIAMALGLATGMGYVVASAIFLAIVAAVVLAVSAMKIGNDGLKRVLKIQIPEDMDYDGLFDDLLQKYTRSFSLSAVKTVNLGT
ncbi:MAG: DUF4956 domain-containing protein, partial [Spirochaetales bacterium]|nr:DUF4956 domain-containing protein [Spirochaetales bacterium]